MNLPRSIPAGFIRSSDGEFSHPRAYPGEVVAARGEHKFTLTPAGMAEVVKPAGQASSILEDRFQAAWRQIGGIELIREYPFGQWRFDFVYLPLKIAVEIQGGVYGGKGHSSSKGMARDYDKGNAAILAGWRVFYLTSKMITTENLNKIKEFLEKPISPAPPPGNG